MSDGDDDNPFIGRITLGAIGLLVLGIGGGTVAYAVTYPSAAGIATYATAGVFGLVGLVALGAAITNPDSLDIDTHTGVDDAEMLERQTDDPLDDEP
jgi:hypothetical protein